MCADYVCARWHNLLCACTYAWIFAAHAHVNRGTHGWIQFTISSKRQNVISDDLHNKCLIKENVSWMRTNGVRAVITALHIKWIIFMCDLITKEEQWVLSYSGGKFIISI